MSAGPKKFNTRLRLLENRNLRLASTGISVLCLIVIYMTARSTGMLYSTAGSSFILSCLAMICLMFADIIIDLSRPS